MKLTPDRQNTPPALDEAAAFGFGTLLVAEAADGGYEPVSIIGTMKEARFLAREDFQNRMQEVAAGGSPMCPDRYLIWSRRTNGYKIISTIPV